MKRSRPLSLFLSVLFLIFLFPVVSLGASDNLISSDLTTWTNLSDLDSDTFPITVTTGGGIYRVTLIDQDYPAYVGAVLDHTSLVAGHSYSLSFKMPTREEVNAAFDRSYSESVFNNHFENCGIIVGIGFISPSGVFTFPDGYNLFEISPDNYTKFFGKSLTASFVASNYSGTPCVAISITSLDGENHSFYFSDFKLVDNDDNSGELTGIKGFLHSIRWDLVGGTCEEEDCPHSSADNPHLSLTERMSSGFAFMFESIGNKFEEGSTLNTWFTNLENKVGNLDVSFTNLGDRISGFFSDLTTNLSNRLSDLGDNITTKFQEIGDEFSEFFEKFKPRVYQDFIWRSGCYINYDGTFYEKEGAYQHVAVVSEYFYASPGCKYLVDFNVNEIGASYGYVVKYDSDYNFISRVAYTEFNEYVLDEGYYYRFQILATGFDFTALPDMSEYCNSYFKVYCEEGWINALFYNIKAFFSSLLNGLGNLILYFNWEGEYTNPFEREDSPIDKVSEWFDNLIEYVDSIGTSIENVLDSITGGLHIFDEFTSRFPWLKGIAVFCLALIVITRFIGL